MSMFNKFRSLDELVKDAVTTLGRFPFTMLSATLGVVISILMVEMDSSDSGLPQRILMAAALGLPLFTALVLLGEKKGWTQSKILALQGAGAALLVGYFFTLPTNLTFESIHAIRFMLLNIGLHILVAILPYLSGKETPGFWNYNKSLFLRFLTAALYSSVLYIGLTIALASADQLFGIDVDGDRYFELWIIMAGILNTWIFLAGVPTDLEKLETMDDYPKGLKVFTQYILLPLVTLYIVILFAYEAKIIITWNWPIGWVSNLVLWYSVVGIFSLLLLHPLREKTENKWIIVFSRWFFRALIPLVVLLFMAILRRISDYGITENRYFVMAMAIGLAIVVLYFVISKIRDIRIIPIVICCIAFLSAYGPWGAFSVSLKSQQNRLEKLLIENNLLADGAIQENSEDIPIENRREMSNIISYLTTWHGLEPFSSWIESDSLKALDSLLDFRQNEQIGNYLGFEWPDRIPNTQDVLDLMVGEQFELKSRDEKPLTIAGYGYSIWFNEKFNFGTLNDKQTYDIDGQTLQTWFDSTFSFLSVQLGDSTGEDNIVRFSVANRIKALRDSNPVWTTSLENLTLSESASNFDAQVILHSVEGIELPDRIKLTSLSAQLLIRVH